MRTLLLGVGVVASVAGAPGEPLRVALVAGAEPAASDAAGSLGLLRAALQRQPRTTVVISAGRAEAKGPSLDSLRTADVAVLHGGSGTLSTSDAGILREFLRKGRGLLVVREQTEGWTGWPGFAREVLGGTRKGGFAGGAPMRVINLFAHAVFTGVPRFETQQAMPLYEELPVDAMLVMEGTVGEATAPLAWLRRTAAGRVAHVLPSEPALFRSPEYLRLLTNTIAWVAKRPIDGARAIVQRTYLPDAYPGAFAITFPEGPAVCFDPARGGVSQVADADFVDLRPRWLTKRGEPARFMGELFFQDAGRDSLWGGGEAAPTFEFKGYQLSAEYPEVFYRVGDRDVRETMRPVPGAPRALRRELHIGPGTQPVRYEQGPEFRGTLAVEGARATARGFVYEASQAGVVRLELRPAAPQLP